MTNINDLNKPLDRSEAGILASVDELVEMGIPRDMADKAVRLAISCCDRVWDGLDRINAEMPDLNTKALTKALFIGGLFNWIEPRAALAQVSVMIVARHYRGK